MKKCPSGSDIMSRLIFTIFLALSLNMSLAQVEGKATVTSNVALKVGDKVPDITMGNLINYPLRKANFSDFKGKLLILDFWSTICRSCVASFPKVESIQAKFGDKVQIVLVNSFENENTIRSFLDKRKDLLDLNITLPVVCGDTSLLRYFPNRTVPHVVWINANGVIESITRGDLLNERNIMRLLNNETIYMPQKTASKIEWNKNKPLFISGNGGNGERLLYQCVLSGYIDGLPSEHSLSIDDQKKIYRINAVNSNIRDLYGLAYSNYFNEDKSGLTGKYGSLKTLPPSHIILQVNDTCKYTARINGEFLYEYLYVYQLTSPPTTRDKLQEMMRSDLKKIFGLNTYWQKIKRKCLVFTTSDTSLISYSGDVDHKWKIDEITFRISNQSMKEVVNLMERASHYYFLPYPIIDETGLHGKIGLIDIQTNVNDYRALDTALKKYKMRFKLEDREFETLIISDDQ